MTDALPEAPAVVEGRGARLLREPWFQVAVAIGVGYAVGRMRRGIVDSPLVRTLAATAVTALVRTSVVKVLEPAAR